jgi:hypothetical protein
VPVDLDSVTLRAVDLGEFGQQGVVLHDDPDSPAAEDTIFANFILGLFEALRRVFEIRPNRASYRLPSRSRTAGFTTLIGRPSAYATI